MKLFTLLWGGSIFIEIAAHFRHLRNLLLFSYAAHSEGIEGQVRYDRWLILRLSATDYDETIRKLTPENKRLLGKLGSKVIEEWKTLVALDAIYFALGKPLAPRFSIEFSKVEFDNFADHISDTPSLHTDIIQAVVKENTAFGDGLRAIPTKHESKAPNLKTYFNNKAVEDAEDLADRFGLLNQCREKGIDNFLNIPTVRSFVGVTLSIQHAKEFQGRKGRDSDGYDIEHAVYASVADTFVVRENSLFDRLKQIPNLPYEVIKPRTLIDRINRSVY